jgi:hypothetical protein
MLPAPSAHHPTTPVHALLFAALLFGTAACSRTIGTGAVRCHYMSYACGDCAPQFRVDSVLNGPLERLLHQDIHVFRDGSTAFVDTLDCLICWTFIAEGSVHLQGGTYTLHAVRLERQLRPDCCSKRSNGTAAERGT